MFVLLQDIWPLMFGLLQGTNHSEAGPIWRRARESQSAESANARTVTMAHETRYEQNSDLSP
jgi:hypothetical protein